MVEDLVAICKEHGYIAPTVYQGIYNIVQRTAETVLLPILRKHGIVFNAYRYVLQP
jgi:aflatoxin B1 aldehyde reductase